MKNMKENYIWGIFDGLTVRHYILILLDFRSILGFTSHLAPHLENAWGRLGLSPSSDAAQCFRPRYRGNAQSTYLPPVQFVLHIHESLSDCGNVAERRPCICNGAVAGGQKIT